MGGRALRLPRIDLLQRRSCSYLTLGNDATLKGFFDGAASWGRDSADREKCWNDERQRLDAIRR